MSLEALRQILTTRFTQNFKKPAPDQAQDFIPVEHENQDFTQPETGEWARFSIQMGERNEASIGTEHERNVGVIYVQLFATRGAGTKKLQEAADKVAEIFDNWQYGQDGWDIEVRRVQLMTVGITRDNHYQKNASVTFRADKRS